MASISDLSALQNSGLIRISRDISDKEKAHVDARKFIVKNCLQKHHIECSMDNVPNIAILGSGGGLRAMIALQGTLGELQEQGLLDTVMYLCGVSGSTWCMSYLYENKNWEKKLQSLEKKMCNGLVNSYWDWNKVLKSMVESSKEDTYSLTDFWGNVVVYLMMHELDDHHLSEEQKVSDNGIVPYPIYAAVDSTKLNANANKAHPGMWFEFTPHEAGFFNPGAFVDMTLFGSKFENGELKALKDEKKMSYLRGLWGSCAANSKENLSAIIDFIRKIISDHLASGAKIQMSACEEAAMFDVSGPKMQMSAYEEAAMVDVSGYRCSCYYCEVALEVIHFLLLLMESETDMMENKMHGDVEKHITRIIEILEDKGPSDTYNFCCALKENSHTLDPTERKEHFLKIAEILQLEFTAEKKLIINHKEVETITSELERSTKEITMQKFCTLQFDTGEQTTIGIGDILRFLRKTTGCIIKWKWGNISNHIYKCIDLKDKNLTKKTDLQLVDAGLVLNSAYPLVLRPERKVKLILSFDFSEGDPFETLKKAGQYCKENKLSFPEIDALNLDKDKKNPYDCYIFKIHGGPTIMHFPLFNRVNCGGNVADWSKKYNTFKISYKQQEITALLKAARENVRNNTDKILQELRTVANS